MKCWKKEDHEEWRNGDGYQREWLGWCEDRVADAVSDCVEILEELRKSYDKYYERQALANAIRHLEMYELGEDVDV